MSADGFGWDEDRRRHVLPGRLLLSVESLERNGHLAARIEAHLRTHPAITCAEARPVTGRVLVLFDPKRLHVDDIEEYVLALARDIRVAATADKVDKVSTSMREKSDALRAEPVFRWHAEPLRKILRRLETSLSHGLDDDEAEKRKRHGGPNEIDTGPPLRFTDVLLQKLRNPITLLLIGTGGVSLAASLWLEAVASLGIAGITTYLGVKQEADANRALDSLAQMSAFGAVVRRNGAWRSVDARTLVPGDIVRLEAGSRVPADARVISGEGLRVDESMLTGESEPVVKVGNTGSSLNGPPAERDNMVYSGTVVVGGGGRIVVVATGMATQLGQLASFLKTEKREPTPLQRRLHRLAKVIAWIIFGLGAAGTMVSVARGVPIGTALAQSAGVAVTAMPHGLPMTVTIALSVVVARLARQGATTRQLSAMESLGATTIICSDKTGTLTRNELVVRDMMTDSGQWSVTGDGYSSSGRFMRGSTLTSPDESIRTLLTTAALCSNARLIRRGDRWRVEGDATEGALLVAGSKAGLDLQRVLADHRRVREVPFSSDSRHMSVVCESDEGVTTIVKGAPEAVLPMCDRVQGVGGFEKLTSQGRDRWLRRAEGLARRGRRVLAIARKSGGIESASKQDRLELLGCVGMIDASRPGVKGVVARCRRGGIRVVMLTGDHPATAETIAREIGIADDDGLLLTGTEIESMSDAALSKKVGRLTIGARLTPEQKLRVVRLLQSEGEVVAMAGDGVNDAPALTAADVGIAMGVSGTDVTRGAANLVLTNDDFRSIVEAVASGRTAYDNIRKSLTFSLSTNGGEAVMALVPLLLGVPFPIPIAALLLSNMLCDGPVSLSLATDDFRRDVTELPLYRSEGSVFNRRETQSIVFRSVGIGLTALGLYAIGAGFAGSAAVGSSMALLGLVGAKLLLARRLHRTGKERSSPGRKRLSPLFTTSAMAGLGLTAISMYVPAAAGFLGLAPLGFASLAFVALTVLVMDRVTDHWPADARLAHLVPTEMHGVPMSI